jgi:hypothetical protein
VSEPRVSIARYLAECLRLNWGQRAFDTIRRQVENGTFWSERSERPKEKNA